MTTIGSFLSKSKIFLANEMGVCKTLAYVLLLICLAAAEEKAESKEANLRFDNSTTLEEGELEEVPHNIPPPVVDPLLCDQLRRENKTSVETHETQKLKLMMLCDHVKEIQTSSKIKRLVKIRSTNTREKREQTTLMKEREQKLVLNMHNAYRRKTKPIAADVKFMKWDPYLAYQAQLWADECTFEHGESAKDPPKYQMGQNLYVGPDSTGFRAMQMWFEEMEYFDYESTECEEGEVCGHYTQVVWSDSEFVGCGVKACEEFGFLVACHYYPAGNVPDVHPFQAGKPCSQCRNKKYGGLCFNDTCVNKEDCENLNLTCKCELECKNCGKFIPRTCRCACKKGWDTLDCSRLCDNNHYHCENDPGWPDSNSCSIDNFNVRDKYCRKMCRQCKPVDDTIKIDSPNDYCCNAKLCEIGEVLQNVTCECIPLCPGPNCVPSESGEENEPSYDEMSNTFDETIHEPITDKPDDNDYSSNELDNELIPRKPLPKSEETTTSKTIIKTLASQSKAGLATPFYFYIYFLPLLMLMWL